MKRAIIAAGTCLVAACATDFQPVEPQPTGFEKDNPCNGIAPIQRAIAEYPASALDTRQPGWVALQYDVAVDGTLANVAIVSSSPPGEFEDAALAAVNQYRYRPSETDASYTGCRLLITFRPPDTDIAQ